MKISDYQPQLKSAASSSDLFVIAKEDVSNNRVERGDLPFVGRVAELDWRPSPFIGPELWKTSNFLVGGEYNSTQVSPSVTADGSQHVIRTLCNLGNMANRDTSFRLSFDVTSLPSSDGWAGLSLILDDATGTALGGTFEQFVQTNVTASRRTGKYVFEFKPDIKDIGGTVLEVRLAVYNNCPSGTFAVSNVSVRQIAQVRRPLFYAESNLGAPGVPEIHQQLMRTSGKNRWNMAITGITGDGDLTRALSGVRGFSEDRVYVNNPPDPTFQASGGNVTSYASFPQLDSSRLSTQLRIGNNDQILSVRKQDGSTFELRGNVHGGEVLKSSGSPDLVYSVDRLGDGDWDSLVEPFGKFLEPAMRFRHVWNTTISRSSPDTDVIANVDHTTTWFPDGVVRTDRSTAFTKSLTLGVVFEWMSSHDIEAPLLGRIGRGMNVINTIDTFVTVEVPAAPTTDTSASGGSLLAATYRYGITALSEAGETQLSATAIQATTGSTSTVTIEWEAVEGATGYRIYGRANAITRMALLATVGANETTWTDDGSFAASGLPPSENTARRLDTTDMALESSVHAEGSWACWYDRATGVVHGMIPDRESPLERAGIAGTYMRILRGAGLTKIYTMLAYDDGAATLSVDGSTVWTATHWHFTYVPADSENWHFEMALKSLDLATLKALYPAV